MPDDEFFAPPPFNAEAALASLKRTLRELHLVDREGTYELKGQPIARARVEGGHLHGAKTDGADRSIGLTVIIIEVIRCGVERRRIG